jgi:hypothetical protein
MANMCAEVSFLQAVLGWGAGIGSSSKANTFRSSKSLAEAVARFDKSRGARKPGFRLQAATTGGWFCDRHSDHYR